MLLWDAWGLADQRGCCSGSDACVGEKEGRKRAGVMSSSPKRPVGHPVAPRLRSDANYRSAEKGAVSEPQESGACQRVCPVGAWSRPGATQAILQCPRVPPRMMAQGPGPRLPGHSAVRRRVSTRDPCRALTVR
jgi:hypothetical protein